MTYKVVISNSKKTFPKNFGFNEILDGKVATYNPRVRKIKYLSNEVKTEGERICRLAIKKHLKGVKIDEKIQCTYYIFVPDKTHDKSNTYAGVEKIFLDSLQKENVIKNDGFNYVDDSIFHTQVDAKNPRVEVIIQTVGK